MIFICINSFCQYFILNLSSTRQLLWDKLGWAEAIIRHMTSAYHGILWMYLFLGKGNTVWTRPKVRLLGIFRIVYLLRLLPTKAVGFALFYYSALSCFYSHPYLSDFVWYLQSSFSQAPVMHPYYSAYKDKLG